MILTIVASKSDPGGIINLVLPDRIKNTGQDNVIQVLDTGIVFRNNISNYSTTHLFTKEDTIAINVRWVLAWLLNNDDFIEFIENHQENIYIIPLDLVSSDQDIVYDVPFGFYEVINTSYSLKELLSNELLFYQAIGDDQIPNLYKTMADVNKLSNKEISALLLTLRSFYENDLTISEVNNIVKEYVKSNRD